MEARWRTLIVDDDPDMALLTATTIELADHGLVVSGIASSGDEALRMLVDVDVVVLDYRMPERNGLEVAADILAAWPDTDIVMFSAFFDVATVAAAEAVGIRECISKDQLRSLPDIIRKYGPAGAHNRERDRVAS